MKPTYFDYASTTPIDADVLTTYQQTQLLYNGNPDGMHDSARMAAGLLKDATAQIATQLRVQPEEILYTSGATEANNLAIFGAVAAYSHRGKHIITTAFEHASVMEPFRKLAEDGYEVTYLPVDENGLIDLDALVDAVRPDTIFVSMIYVHNELGTIQPIEALTAAVKSANQFTIVHVDMAQAVGKVDNDVEHIDLATFSAHKFYGPKSSGILMKKKNVQLQPLIYGGQQQHMLRPGTLNAPLIAATSKALRLAMENQVARTTHVQQLNDELRAFFDTQQMVTCTINDSVATPYILHVTITDPVTQIETYVHAFNQFGIEVATRSTCHSKSVHLPNDVLVAIGMSEAESRMGLRISLSHHTTFDDIALLKEACSKIEKLLYFK